MPSAKAQLDHYVGDVLLPRVQELVSAAESGASPKELRRIFERDIAGSLNLFFELWMPVYEVLKGREEARRSEEVAKQLIREAKKATQEDFTRRVVKALWFLLSLSLEGMVDVPVFEDQLTFAQLSAAIRDATWRIS